MPTNQILNPATSRVSNMYVLLALPCSRSSSINMLSLCSFQMLHAILLLQSVVMSYLVSSRCLRVIIIFKLPIVQSVGFVSVSRSLPTLPHLLFPNIVHLRNRPPLLGPPPDIQSVALLEHPAFSSAGSTSLYLLTDPASLFASSQ